MEDLNEDHFRKNWDKTRLENKKLDAATDRRIRKGIDARITPGNAFKKYYWSAAAAAIIAGSIALVYINDTQSTEPLYHYTSAAQSRNISLPDGSTVVLYPHASVTLAEDFGRGKRKLSFSGKAVFDVHKDPAHPFVIETAEFTVSVLGTKFLLDQTSGAGKVDLYEGKVKIEHEGTVTYLSPNQSWSETAVTANVKSAEKASTTTEMAFIFNDEAFADIILELESTYGVKITFPQEYQNRRIQGSFSGNLEEVLTAIGYPFSVKPVKTSANTIQLK